MATDARQILYQLCGILATQMNLNLSPGQEQIWIYEQKRIIPSTLNLWVVVGILTERAYGNNSFMDQAGTEYQSINMSGMFTVDIFSRDDSALAQKELIPLAFSSQYAQQQAQKFAFKIARIPTQWTNIGVIDGAAIPYHFQLSILVQYLINLNRSAEYYDSFTDEITVEA